MIHGPSETKTQRSQRAIERSLILSSSTKPASSEKPVSETDVATVLHFAVFVYVDVQQQVGQAVARGQRRKAVNRDTSGVGHRGVTNLRAPIWFTGQGHIAPFFVT